jgi:glycosyltransferase involved in cell wall biosynthesis
MAISAIVPAHDSAAFIGECLDALHASSSPIGEIVVVDDGSTDDTAAVATAAGARVLRQPANRGPAVARNAGAAAASGDVLFFVDADVVVARDAAARITRLLDAHPDVAAVFGSYDARPRAPGLVSQYRNLLHHWVHQQASPDAFTFWAGCGAVRRSVFEAIGGFDGDAAWCFIEDIELGHRLRRAGHRIVLDKDLQGTHLKRWTLGGVLWTDVLYRAAPWTRLIRRGGAAPHDLNLARGQRWSVALVGLAGVCLALALVSPPLAAIAAAALAAVVVLNRRFYAFLRRQRGGVFAAACVPLHVLYFACCGAGFAYGCLTPPARS